MDPATARYQNTLKRLRRAAVAHSTVLWRQLPSIDRSQVPAFVAEVVPIVEAAQRQAVALTTAYQAHRLDISTPALDVDRLIGTYARNGADPELVYGRPFISVWSALKDGTSYADAVAQGLDRLQGLADEDVALAARDAAGTLVATTDGVTGWERVPDGQACDFCLMASTQTYSSGDLMDLHDRCGCTVEPITDKEPGQITDPDLRDQLTQQGIDPTVYQHGELGPVLASAGDRNTDSADLIGRTAEDWAGWDRSQNWDITSLTPDRIDAVRGAQSIAWQPAGDSWRIAA